MQHYLQFPELTELGGLTGLTVASVKADEAKIKTPFAFATAPFCATFANYSLACEVLKKCGWRVLGNRYNAGHGPNYISLWWKKFPANKPQKLPYVKYWPNYASACCGLRLGTAEEVDNAYLQLARCEGPTRKSTGWTQVAKLGDISYWTNANSGNFLAKKDASKELKIFVA